MESKFDHEHTDEIVCPWCGHEFSDSYEYDDSDDVECVECEKKFHLTVERTVTYSTMRPKCKSELHEFEKAERCIINQDCCDRWNREKFLERSNHTPHTLWSRVCKKCHFKETIRKSIDQLTSPWEENACEQTPAPARG